MTTEIVCFVVLVLLWATVMAHSGLLLWGAVRIAKRREGK